MKKRCFAIETGIVLKDPEEPYNGYEKYCSTTNDCPTDYICGRMIKNPNFGISNFDNIGYSFLMVF